MVCRGTETVSSVLCCFTSTTTTRHADSIMELSSNVIREAFSLMWKMMLAPLLNSKGCSGMQEMTLRW